MGPIVDGYYMLLTQSLLDLLKTGEYNFLGSDGNRIWLDIVLVESRLLVNHELVERPCLYLLLWPVYRFN